MAGGPTAGIGERELCVGPPPHQSQDAQRLVTRHLVPMLHRFLVSLDLGSDGVAQAEALGHHLAGELLEPIVEGGVEVSQRLEQAERNQGGDGRSCCHVMAITK